MNEDKLENEINATEIEGDPLSELFEERDKSPQIILEEKVIKDAKANKDVSSGDKGKSSFGDKKNKEGERIYSKKEKEDDDIHLKDSEDVSKIKDELEKTQKRLSENQKYAHKHVQKVKNATKVVKSLIDDGNLTEEEAQNVLKALESEEEEGEDHYRGDSHPFSPIFRVANKELENIRKYTDDDILNDKIAAFDYFLSVSSEAEIKEAFEELTGFMDNPVKLAKRMLAIGQQTYEDSYKDIKESGGVKNLLSIKTQEVEKLQKKIDKLEKKLSQYESYDKPTYRIDEMGEKDSKESDSEDPLTPMFKARDNIRQR